MVYIILLVAALLLFLIYASYYIGSGVYVKALCRGERSEKRVFLTFDDAISENTPKLLDILKRERAKAIFFCIGEKLEGKGEPLARIVKEGHIVGCHSYSHKALLPLWSRKSILEDYRKCNDMIASVVEPPFCFRPPFGVTNPTIGYAVKKLDYKVIGWTIRSYDTSINSPEKVVRRVMRRVKNGAIILLHDHVEKAPVILEKLLKELKEQGYKTDKLPIEPKRL